MPKTAIDPADEARFRAAIRKAGFDDSQFSVRAAPDSFDAARPPKTRVVVARKSKNIEAEYDHSREEPWVAKATEDVLKGRFGPEVVPRGGEK